MELKEGQTLGCCEMALGLGTADIEPFHVSYCCSSSRRAVARTGACAVALRAPVVPCIPALPPPPQASELVQGQRSLSAEPQASNSLLFYFSILETESSKQTSNQANRKCPSPIKIKKESKQAVLCICSSSGRCQEVLRVMSWSLQSPALEQTRGEAGSRPHPQECPPR